MGLFEVITNNNKTIVAENIENKIKYACKAIFE